MTPAKIRSEIKTALKIVQKKRSLYEEARKKEHATYKDWENAIVDLQAIRRQCKHKFDNEKSPTVMGRGNCIFCGESDY